MKFFFPHVIFHYVRNEKWLQKFHVSIKLFHKVKGRSEIQSTTKNTFLLSRQKNNCHEENCSTKNYLRTEKKSSTRVFLWNCWSFLRFQRSFFCTKDVRRLENEVEQILKTQLEKCLCEFKQNKLTEKKDQVLR